MSYDLMVFDPAVAPRDRDAFRAFYLEQTKWGEGHSYGDPRVTTPALRAFLFELVETFPAMNGPLALPDSEADEAAVTDYSIGKSVIYAAFAWSKAEAARETMVRLAGKHGIGFFDVSAKKAAIFFPNGTGGLDITGVVTW